MNAPDQLPPPSEPHVMKTYARLPLALSHGRGCSVWDTEGKRYLDGLAGIGCQAPIAPGIFELGGQLGVELETPARQSIERAAAAPVECQEAPRLAGGRTTDGMPLDHDGPCTASAEVVGDGDADRAPAADDDAFGPAHAITVSGSACGFQASSSPRVRLVVILGLEIGHEFPHGSVGSIPTGG